MPVQRIGVLGGTFDPVHYGHLRFAMEFRDAIALAGADARVHLVPCHIPPHRDEPLATPLQRLEMLRLAIGDRPGFQIDQRELRSGEPSFTFDTLASIRGEFPAAQLILAVGMDVFEDFRRWHRWRDILELASLLVSTRPGARANSVDGWPRQVALDELREPGQIATLNMTPIDISSSHIRQLIASDTSPDYLLPETVAGYISANKLYRAQSSAVIQC